MTFAHVYVRSVQQFASRRARRGARLPEETEGSGFTAALSSDHFEKMDDCADSLTRHIWGIKDAAMQSRIEKKQNRPVWNADVSNPPWCLYFIKSNQIFIFILQTALHSHI